MYSTPEESLRPSRSPVDTLPRSPTIEQIAMGLHISRTPHLGASKAYSPRSRHRDPPEALSPHPRNPTRPTHRRGDSAPPTIVQLPPPPQRSAMRKPESTGGSLPSLSVPLTPSDSHTSLSTLTSTHAPSTPRSSRSGSVRAATFASRLQFSMSRLLLPMRKNSAASLMSASTSTSDASSAELAPRKTVRFSAVPKNIDEL
ncbi:hypothetical protein BDW22DRAFT_578942 [Trametopsis cervina]|nr:hypothetical protein BDW22DRAFT_578942 [Trametopsis cervina]